MTGKLSFIAALILVSIFIFSCKGRNNGKADSADSGFFDDSTKKEEVTQPVNYPNAPDPEDFYKSPNGLLLIDTLRGRFTDDLVALDKEVTAAHAKFYVCYITTEVGGDITACEKNEKPFIAALCKKQHIPFIDFTNEIVKHGPEITFMPIDGHFNGKGAMLVANKMATIIDSNKNYRSDVSYPASSIPALLGDEDTSVDRIVEDKKGLPYKLVTNKQGLRMNGLVEIPKKKQHILLEGDSEIYLAGVDNPETITGILQKRYPDKTIINASKWGYTIDDELLQWQQRTKYTEPDIVILQVSGLNIPNLYFSQKIKFHRSGNKKPFTPSPLEEKFYNAGFK